MEKVPWLRAYFPNAGVGRFPVPDDIFDGGTQTRPTIVADGGAIFIVQIDAIQQFTVDIQLRLIMRCVADPHRP